MQPRQGRDEGIVAVLPAELDDALLTGFGGRDLSEQIALTCPGIAHVGLEQLHDRRSNT